MIRHTKIGKDTKIDVDDEVLYKGKWEKVININKDFIILELQIIVTIADLTQKWEVTTFKDCSDSNPEYSINLVNVAKSANTKIVLFDENSLAYTKDNFEKLVILANVVKDYMNKEQINFEEEVFGC